MLDLSIQHRQDDFYGHGILLKYQYLFKRFITVSQPFSFFCPCIPLKYSFDYNFDNSPPFVYFVIPDNAWNPLSILLFCISETFVHVFGLPLVYSHFWHDYVHVVLWIDHPVVEMFEDTFILLTGKRGKKVAECLKQKKLVLPCNMFTRLYSKFHNNHKEHLSRYSWTKAESSRFLSCPFWSKMSLSLLKLHLNSRD